jgi:hypothetical protein
MREPKEKSLLRFRRAAARGRKRPNHRQLGACAEAQKIFPHSRASKVENRWTTAARRTRNRAGRAASEGARDFALTPSLAGWYLSSV